MPMTASELRTVAQAYGGQQKLARAMGMDGRNFRRLVAGDKPITEAMEARIRQAVAEQARALARFVGESR